MILSQNILILARSFNYTGLIGVLLNPVTIRVSDDSNIFRCPVCESLFPVYLLVFKSRTGSIDVIDRNRNVLEIVLVVRLLIVISSDDTCI